MNHLRASWGWSPSSAGAGLPRLQPQILGALLHSIQDSGCWSLTQVVRAPPEKPKEWVIFQCHVSFQGCNIPRFAMHGHIFLQGDSKWPCSSYNVGVSEGDAHTWERQPWSFRDNWNTKEVDSQSREYNGWRNTCIKNTLDLQHFEFNNWRNTLNKHVVNKISRYFGISHPKFGATLFGLHDAKATFPHWGARF